MHNRIQNMKEKEIFKEKKTISNIKLYREKLNILEENLSRMKKEKEILKEENRLLKENYYAIPKFIRNIFMREK